MALQEKLDAFQRGAAVLHTPTQEIFSKLMDVFVEQGLERLPNDYWVKYRANTGVDYSKAPWTTFTPIQWYRKKYPNLTILEVTGEDFNDSSLPAGIQKRMQEINGYTNDIVMCHGAADELLCDILEQQGFHEVVKWFEQLHGRDYK